MVDLVGDGSIVEVGDVPGIARVRHHLGHGAVVTGSARDRLESMIPGVEVLPSPITDPGVRVPHASLNIRPGSLRVVAVAAVAVARAVIPANRRVDGGCRDYVGIIDKVTVGIEHGIAVRRQQW